ncbi:MAG: hypothetical protein EBX41_03750 [Chitinophagia bacterium]|nr:hypothetical protein [Chitinophagia bacterium]
MLFGGKPNKVKHIKISETMRPNIHSVGANTVMSLYPDIDSSEVLGCWDESLCSIVINRNQLISLDDYAGTLIHELIHAKTGYEDVSRNFEYVLTKTIGKITKQALT